MATFHLSKTKNKKLGKGVYASTSSADTCSISCPLFTDCYAKKGPQSWNWAKVTKGERGTDWATFCDSVEQLKPNTLFRHNVSGDLPYVKHYEGETWRCIDTAALDKLQCAVVNSEAKMYTYTHLHTDQMYGETNLDTVARFSQPNFVINLSTEKPREALKLKQKGFDVVITNTDVFELAVYSIKHRKQPANIVCNGESVKVLPCPEQYTESATCATCKLCARNNRDFVIAFKKH
jgi:hypothetical protein